ncbi:hypothetical protein [Vibrio splendidus]
MVLTLWASPLSAIPSETGDAIKFDLGICLGEPLRIESPCGYS